MNDFDRWNNLKQKLNLRGKAVSPSPIEGEVWVGALGLNIGSEQNGKGIKFQRPLLVVKKFNASMAWCVPLSTKQKPLFYYFNFTDPINQRSSAILAQLRLVSTKRFYRRLYNMPSGEYREIRKRLKALL